MALATPALYPAFFFVLEKAVKGAGNAVIPTFPTRWSHGLQHLRHKRRNVRFEGLRRVHTCLRQQDRTQRITGRNRGVSDGGWYHYPRSVSHVHKHPRAGYQNGVLCRFWVLVGGAPKERREPRDSDALMRVAAPRRRGPAGLRGLFSFLSKLRFSHSVLRAFRVCETWEVSLPSACSACC